MTHPPSHRQVRRAVQPQPTERDILEILSFCIDMSAEFAKVLQERGQAEPELFDSLKGMQLMVDRMERSAARQGIKKTNEDRPSLSDIQPYLGALCSDIMSPQR